MVAQYFGPIPQARRACCRTLYTVEPAQDGERSVSLRRVRRHAVCHGCVPHPVRLASRCGGARLADNTAGRRTHRGASTRAWWRPAERPGVFAYTALHDPGVIMLGAQVRKDASLDSARDSTAEDRRIALASHPITREELERARGAGTQADRTRAEQFRAGRPVAEQWMGMGDWRLYFLHRDQIRAGQASKTSIASRQNTCRRSIARSASRMQPTRPARVEIPASPSTSQPGRRTTRAMQQERRRSLRSLAG